MLLCHWPCSEFVFHQDGFCGPRLPQTWVMYCITGITLIGHRNFSSFVWCSEPCWLLYSLKLYSWFSCHCGVQDHIYQERERSEGFYVLRLRRISYLTISLFLWFLFECIKECSCGFIPISFLNSFFCFGSHNSPQCSHIWCWAGHSNFLTHDLGLQWFFCFLFITTGLPGEGQGERQ